MIKLKIYLNLLWECALWSKELDFLIKSGEAFASFIPEFSKKLKVDSFVLNRFSWCNCELYFIKFDGAPHAEYVID